MRRCRVVTEYPQKDSRTGRRWDENTPLIINTTFQGRILPISKLWTAVAYFPFPEAPESTIVIPDIPVISEEQNCSLELGEDDVPLLHFEMWQKDVKNRPTKFTNRAYNLCLGMDRYKAEEADMWDMCKNIALEDMSNRFCAPGHHPLHKSARYHFFDEDYGTTNNNLPLLLAQQQTGQAFQLKSPDELVTLILSNALLGRLPFVSPPLGTCIRNCIGVMPREAWNNLEEALTVLLWSGDHADLNAGLVKEFHNWCAGNRGIFPAWAVASSSLRECPKHAFFAAVLDTVALYQHDYELPHLSGSAFSEEVKLLSCDTEARSFTWEGGHSRATLLTSNWVKRKLHVQSSQTMEVKTNPSFGGTYSGERLDLHLTA